MSTQLTVRLPDDLSKDITIFAKRLHLKRSDIVRMALKRFIGEVEEKKEETPYERVKNLIGSFSSGLPDLGESHRKYLIERIKKNAKYPA